MAGGGGRKNAAQKCPFRMFWGGGKNGKKWGWSDSWGDKWGDFFTIIRNHTTKFSGSPTGMPNFFAHKKIGKPFRGHPRNG